MKRTKCKAYYEAHAEGETNKHKAEPRHKEKELPDK